MEQQAWILRSLLAQLDRQRAEDDETPDSIAAEFARLKSQSTKYRTDKTYPTKAAEKQENIKKNRYKDIVPFDHTRVKLSFTTTKNDTDYINASFIKGVSESRAYIATQGPLPHTVVDFLRMLWEHNVRVVVMACREFEMGKKKCEVYWPQKKEKSFSCEPFTVYCDSEENKGDYLTRTLRVTYRNCSRTLKQLHYVNWPDHGVPNSIPPILDMLHEMRSYQNHDDVPICIHCSAGCGRTGVLCVIDYTWNLLKKQTVPADFSIYDLVQDMRTQRPSVVQTKEQYELVYRTIKLLFQRYLESMDAEKDQNAVTMAPPAITESELSDLSQEFSMKPHFQHLLDEERDSLQHHHAPSSPASDNVITVKANDLQSDLLQQRLPRTCTEDLATPQGMQEKPRTPTKQEQTSQSPPEVEERTRESDELQSLNPVPSPSVAATICQLVEDPYFDTPLSSPSSEDSTKNPTEEQWKCSPIFSPPSLFLNDHNMELDSRASGRDEETPPPLPERTPESYVLVEDTEPAETCEMLSVIIPTNAAAEAVRELQGSPPSPVPPLPERTPESYELATDQVEEKLKVTPAVNLNKIGSSLEWSGNSNPAAAPCLDEGKPFMRSKSLKLKMTFSAPVTHRDLTSNMASNFSPACPLDPPNSLHLHQSEKSITAPFPDRTQDSFLFKAEEHEKSRLYPQSLETAHPTIRTGMSSEWDGTSQPKFFDVIMNRSKSVRAKSSRQESLAVFQPLAPLPVTPPAGGSAQAHTERSGNTPEKSSEKDMFRRKSLKFFRHKTKPKTAPPPPPTQPGALSQPPSTPPSLLKFGFGSRFGKPKGPRKYPDTWV